MATPVVTLKDVGYTYNPGHRNARTVFEGVDLVIGAGQMVGIVGPSGSGKTTLLSVMAHLLQPTMGQVFLFETETTGNGTAQARREYMGLVTQTGDLDPSLTAEEQVHLIPRLLGHKVSRAQARDSLEQVGLPEEAWASRPRNLSGGEKQRVALARALACRPSVIFADEPTANLDGHSKAAVLDTMKAVKPRECAVVIVSHDVDVVGSYCSRVIRMQDGTLTEE
jgi:putative ABC transport system ATP-binding protein